MTTTIEEPLPELLRTWRGDMKLDRAAVYLSDRLGREISRETIRRYETGQVPLAKMDGAVLAGLARVYGHSAADLPASGREIAEKVRHLFVYDDDTDPDGAPLVDLTDGPDTPTLAGPPPGWFTAGSPPRLIAVPDAA